MLRFLSRKWARGLYEDGLAFAENAAGLRFLVWLIVSFPGCERLLAGQLLWPSPLSDEKKIGKETLEMIKEHLPLVEDGEVLTYVQVGRQSHRQAIGKHSLRLPVLRYQRVRSQRFCHPGRLYFYLSRSHRNDDQ